MDKSTLKLYVEEVGDTSVGIFPSTITVDMGFSGKDFDKGERKKFREGFIKLLQEHDLPLYGFRGAYWSDECPDCGAGNDEDCHCYDGDVKTGD